jgi:hypothetical protein
MGLLDEPRFIRVLIFIQSWFSWFLFNFLFHHSTLSYWVLSFMIFSSFFYVSLSRSHITNLRFFMVFFFIFFISSFEITLLGLKLCDFFYFSFCGVTLSRRFVKLTWVDFGVFRYSFYFSSVFFSKSFLF